MTSAPLPTLPENPSLLTRIKIGYKALKAAKEDPGNPIAGALINDCFEQEVYARLVEEMRQHPDGKTLLEERPSMQAEDVDLDAWWALPEGTLGRELAQYYEDHQIEPFSTDQPLRNDVDYVSKRYRETHDIYHLLTGYGTDVMGEMQLQAFVRGNLGIRAPLMILPFAFLSAKFGKEDSDDAPLELGEYMHKVRAAQKRGATIEPLIHIRFEDHMARPIKELRQMFLDGEAP